MQPVYYCCGKVIYDKKGAVTAKNKRFQDGHVALRIYECNGHWHLTHVAPHRGEYNKKRNGFIRSSKKNYRRK